MNYSLRTITRGGHERGMSILEVLFLMGFVAIIGLAVTHSTILSLDVTSKNIHSSAASQLAIETLEQYSTVSPNTLSNANNTFESDLDFEGMSFNRTVSISINSDRSRTVQVVVASNNQKVDTSVSMENTYALWGSN